MKHESISQNLSAVLDQTHQSLPSQSARAGGGAGRPKKSQNSLKTWRLITCTYWTSFSWEYEWCCTCLNMFELNSIRHQKNQQSKTTHQTILPTHMWWKRRLLEYSRVPPSLFQQGFCKCTICFFNVTRASWFTAKSWRTLTTWLKMQNLMKKFWIYCAPSFLHEDQGAW